MAVARAGFPCTLYEMRPVRQRGASHRAARGTGLQQFLKSDQHPSLPGSQRGIASVRLAASSRCERARVPGGHALTVDREVFGAEITRAIESEPLIEVRREEVDRISIIHHDRCTGR